MLTVFMISAVSGCGPDTEGSASGNAGSGSQNSGRQNSQVQTENIKYDENKLSDEYLVGMDYFTGDFLEFAPTVIVKVRYDGMLEAEFDHTTFGPGTYTDVRLFEMTEAQKDAVFSAIDLKHLFNLDPEEADPATTMDGGCSYLIIYDKQGDVYKRCGGFCPHNRDFNQMRRVVYENLPEEFLEYCEIFKKIWQDEENYIRDLGKYYKYGVFIGYDGELSALSYFDAIVIDAQYFDEDEIREYQWQYGHDVLSYINVGSVEEFRDYYDEYSDLALGEYENWEDEVWVDVSDERWQRFILDELAPELKNKGISGFFVDNCDVYYNYPTEEILEGLSVIMEGLRSMGLEVIINGGDTFLDAYCENGGVWSDVISGINQECVFTAINWEDDSFMAASDEDSEYFRDYIERYASLGAFIYLLEYTEDASLVKDIDGYCYNHQFAYCVSDTLNLDHIPE